MAEVIISKAMTRRVAENVTATKAHIVGFAADFGRSIVQIEVQFRGANDAVYDRELWLVKGADIVAALNRSPVGGSGLAVMQEALEWIVDKVENTAGKKQQLIDDGDLIVRSGSLLS